MYTDRIIPIHSVNGKRQWAIDNVYYDILDENCVHTDAYKGVGRHLQL